MIGDYRQQKLHTCFAKNARTKSVQRTCRLSDQVLVYRVVRTSGDVGGEDTAQISELHSHLLCARWSKRKTQPSDSEERSGT